MPESNFHLYDKLFKKTLTLSPVAVVNLINGLFGTDYPSDSSITYHWTEFEDEKLCRTLADTILTVGDAGDSHSYHIEAQMTRDDDIILRVFEYGFGQAQRYAGQEDEACITFPAPMVIYLCAGNSLPDEYRLRVNFEGQGTFLYRVPVIRFQSLSAEEINERKLAALLPFRLLKLRERIRKNRSEKNVEALKNLIQSDIIGNINCNLAAGNITQNDAYKMMRYTQKLYDHVYSRYEELEELNKMTDESLMFDIDILEKKYETAMAEKDAAMAEKDAAMAEKDAALAENAVALAENAAEIARLRQQVAELQEARRGQR
ncbi:MAG: hypothetical protein NC489_17170 [Ruminococcus flavefaciens]|nr:hypothetical protein [Ruminococcus flavefaciens]